MSFGKCSIKKLFKFEDNAVHFISFITVHGRPEVLCKNSIVKNFVNFAGKHLCQGLFFNKLAGLRPATLLKQRLWYQCFPVNVTKFIRMPFFREWLLLKAADNHKIIPQTHALAGKNACKNLTQKKNILFAVVLYFSIPFCNFSIQLSENLTFAGLKFLANNRKFY